MTFLTPCEIGSGFEEPGGNPPQEFRRVLLGTPRNSMYQLTFNGDREALLEAEYKLIGGE